MGLQSAGSSVLIIGAGAFGATTALSIKEQHPEATVIVVDQTPFPCPMGAGHDYNKIVRADYDDPLYLKLALKAMKSWESDPLYSQHFHKTGFLWSEKLDVLQPVMDVWEQVVGKNNFTTCLMDPDTAMKGFGGIFQSSDWSKISKCLFSPDSGWADSAAAIESVMQAAVDLGVKYMASGISKIIFDDAGRCAGATTSDGSQILADRTILAAGASIPYILAQSAPGRPEIHVGDRLVAVGAPMAAFRVTAERMQAFQDCPVHGLSAALPAELIPPGENHLVKCTHESAFTNNVKHELTQTTISVPPFERDKQTWSQNMPQILKNELKMIHVEYFGEDVTDVEPEWYRMCWDGFTPSQDWMICPHPHAANLYIAGGGSFHGFKFLPILGDLVVQMVLGQLDKQMQTRWAWDRENNGQALPEFWPKRDLSDLC